MDTLRGRRSLVTYPCSRATRLAHMSTIHCIRVAVIGLACALPASTVGAQNARGKIQDRVSDSTSAVLRGASVTVTPGGARTVTDAEGGYTVGGLAPGDYTVGVNFIGFREFSTSAHVV